MKIVVCLLIVTFALNSFSQKNAKKTTQLPDQTDTNCGAFKNLKFKKGVDTIILKATYSEMVASTPGGSLFKTLDREKKLNSKMFTYDLGIKPDGCSEIVYAPSSIKTPGVLRNGKAYYFTCIVFENKAWEYKGLPFFVIIGARSV